MSTPTTPQNPAHAHFKLGLIPSPRHVLMAARPFAAATPPAGQAFWKSAGLNMWGNSQYGMCVTSEEMFALSAYYAQKSMSEQKAIEWARSHGWLNGAMLPEVMQAMAEEGISDGGKTFKDGAALAVDYSNEAALQAALDLGPVKTGIDASALPSGAGNQQGWVAKGGRPQQFTNEDHCVGLSGYGDASYLFGQLGLPVPSGAPARGYTLFTWATVGMVDHDWIMSTMGEAWLRNPTTVGYGPPPGPGPGPGPGPQTVSTMVNYDQVAGWSLAPVPGPAPAPLGAPVQQALALAHAVHGGICAPAVAVSIATATPTLSPFVTCFTGFLAAVASGTPWPVAVLALFTCILSPAPAGQLRAG